MDAKKLKQVFKLAGRIVSVDLSLDKDGNSRGFAVVEYDHPVEAVQAISMFDRQTLFERRMTVRLDRIPDKGESLKLPEGLKGIGIGLGTNGEPLKNVAYNLACNNNNQNKPQPPSASLNGGGGSQPPVHTPGVTAAGLLGPVPLTSLPNNPLSNQPSLAALIGNLSGTLSNPLLNPSTLSALSGLGGLANSAGVGNAGGVQQQNDNQQGQSQGFNNNSSQGGFQSSYSTPVFNTNLASMRNRNDYDQGNNSNSAVRNYSTQDFNSRGGQQQQNAYGNAVSSSPFGNNSGQSNNNAFGNNNSGSSNLRKSDTIVIKNVSY